MRSSAVLDRDREHRGSCDERTSSAAAVTVVTRAEE
jgi:hypothetical protein